MTLTNREQAMFQKGWDAAILVAEVELSAMIDEAKKSVSEVHLHLIKRLAERMLKSWKVSMGIEVPDPVESIEHIDTQESVESTGPYEDLG